MVSGDVSQTTGPGERLTTWDSSYVPFVEAGTDSIGAFLYGVYRHYATADSQFLDDLWPNVKGQVIGC